jgi:hypothetical protein
LIVVDTGELVRDLDTKRLLVQVKANMERGEILTPRQLTGRVLGVDLIRDSDLEGFINGERIEAAWVIYPSSDSDPWKGDILGAVLRDDGNFFTWHNGNISVESVIMLIEETFRFPHKRELDHLRKILLFTTDS